MKITSSNITKLKKNEIFVFGSNLAGNHAGGAAKLAAEKFGAESGIGEGLSGQSYAFPTLNERLEKREISGLQESADLLLKVVKENPHRHFMITEVGCGIAGYKVEEIAPVFLEFLNLENISIPQSFFDILSNSEIKGFKGFEQNMKCRDFQYEFEKSYEMDGTVKACNRGFHFCEHPLNVFEYYPPNNSRYATVTGSGQISREPGGDTKVAVSKLHIGAEISLKGLTEAAVKFVFDRAKWKEGPVATENNEGVTASGSRGAATASGDQGAATASGDQGAATASGDQGAATASGSRGAATASGDQGAATASGYQGAATASGYQGAATASGYQGAATASGDQGAATASGYQGAATASGSRGAATALGIEGKAKASLGGWITLSEWIYTSKGWERIDVQTAKVDGEKIKPDTFYKLINGQFKEVKE